MVHIKNFYLSPRDFERNCPCAYHLNAYLETLIPAGTAFDLKAGEKLDAEKYAATYDIFSPNGSYSIEAVCDMSDKEVDLCQYFGQKKLKAYAAFFNSSSSFC